MKKQYPSDITKEQFEQTRPLLESGRKKTAPRKVDLYEVFCAILYLLKSGCQWRMLPEGFPKWNTVYYYFSLWDKAQDGQQSRLHQCLKKLIGQARIKQGRKSCNSSLLIVDAQSVKNTDSAEGKGYDAGKKISGISSI